MHVFKKYYDQLPETVIKQWEALCKPGGPAGKREKKNELINATVPRNTNYAGGLEVRNATLNNCTVLKRSFDRQRLETGFTETEMESKYGETLFRKGLARGDFWHDPKDNLYYTKSTTRTRSDGYEEKQTLNRNTEVLSHSFSRFSLMKAQCASFNC